VWFLRCVHNRTFKGTNYASRIGKTFFWLKQSQTQWWIAHPGNILKPNIRHIETSFVSNNKQCNEFRLRFCFCFLYDWGLQYAEFWRSLPKGFLKSVKAKLLLCFIYLMVYFLIDFFILQEKIDMKKENSTLKSKLSSADKQVESLQSQLEQIRPLSVKFMLDQLERLSTCKETDL